MKLQLLTVGVVTTCSFVGYSRTKGYGPVDRRLYMFVDALANKLVFPGMPEMMIPPLKPDSEGAQIRIDIIF